MKLYTEGVKQVVVGEDEEFYTEETSLQTAFLLLMEDHLKKIVVIEYEKERYKLFTPSEDILKIWKKKENNIWEKIRR